METIKILFINHTLDMVGGSSQSLRNLIQNIGQKVDLLVPKNCNVTNKTIRAFYGINVYRIYRCDLPFRRSAEGMCWFISWSDWFQRELAYQQNKGEIEKIISRNKYTAIHLNSYVLYPLIRSKYPMYAHVREVCNAKVLKWLIQTKYRKSKGIIYIDNATKKALGVEERSIVLNNPFDQKKTLEVDLQDARRKYSIQEDETVFTFISASNNPMKGLSFVVEAFIKADCRKVKLLVVGPEKVLKYNRYSNIIFTGRVSQTEEIYAISDYILRGDENAVIGRTIYEGLYSGCGIIIPGDAEQDMSKMFESEKFQKNIFFYKARNLESLAQTIKQKSFVQKEAVLGLSNAEDYAETFKKFVLKDKSV